MSEVIYDDWGAWIAERATRVGHARNVDLAKRVGCRPEQVSRWFRMKTPPATMRKGFDVGLADALAVPSKVLQDGWRFVGPESLPIDVPRVPQSTSAADETTLRRKVLAIVELLDVPQLGELHDKGRELLAAGMTHKAVA